MSRGQILLLQIGRRLLNLMRGNEDQNMAQSLLSRLRSLVGPKRWDYVIYWTLSEDQRCLEFAGCLCSGADQVGQGCSDAHGLFTNRYCRDVMVPHPKSLTCEVLADFPVSFPLDVGVQGQVLLSGQPRWMHFSVISDPNIGHESVQTRVLIPIRNGLLELFVPKPVAENPSIVQYILAQWEACLPQPQIFDGNNMYNQTSAGLGGFNVSSEASAVSTLPWLSVADSQVPWETDRPICEPQIPINMASPSLNFLNQELHQHQQPQTSIQILPPKADFKDSPHPSCLSKEMHAGDKTADFKQENPRADSSECSDHIEDDDDQKGTGRSGRRHLSKNLVAERKRRIKLNERLYALRALVPKITKMDKASILGDAIEYIKELQQEVKELQDELAETDGLDNGVQAVHDDDAHGRCLSKTENIKVITNPPREDLQTLQIDVNQLEAQVFNLRIFNDKREGCFVRLLQAMDALGLDILNCNITTFGTLVLNVFNAQKRDKEELHAEQLRETLLEMTLNPELVQQFEATSSSSREDPELPFIGAIFEILRS